MRQAPPVAYAYLRNRKSLIVFLFLYLPPKQSPEVKTLAQRELNKLRRITQHKYIKEAVISANKESGRTILRHIAVTR